MSGGVMTGRDGTRRHGRHHGLGAAARGFTLLEMLLVVTILGALAFTATAFVENGDDQLRYEDTRTRLEMIRRAVAGEAAPVYGGQVVVSGYVADNGALPGDIASLIADPDPSNPGSFAAEGYAANGLQSPVFDGAPEGANGFNDGGTLGTDIFILNGAAQQLEKGWRAGYLHAAPGTNGAFRDGWGNISPALPDPPDYRWQWAVVSGALTVTSLGKDNTASGTGYAADMADTLTPSGWSSGSAGLMVRVMNQSGTDYPTVVGQRLRASLLVFVNNANPVGPNDGRWKRYSTDALTCLDGSGDGLVGSLPCSNLATLTFPAGGYPGGTYADTRIPQGLHLLLLVADSDVTAHNGSSETPYPNAASPVSRHIVCTAAGCPVETLVIR